MTEPHATKAEAKSVERRALLKNAGRFAAVTAPAVTLILTAAAKPKKALAVSVASSRQFKDRIGTVG